MKPRNRGQLINYGLRQLGAPILQINVDDDQLHDLVDDTVQLYHCLLYTSDAADE